MKRFDKKGSHVGVVLSFVIFITFLAFLYSVLEPRLKIQKDKESFLDYLRLEILERVSNNLISISVTIEKTNPQFCVQLDDFVSELNLNPVIMAKGTEGELFPTQISEENLQIDRGAGEEFFFKIYSSEEFEEISGGDFSPCKAYQKDEEYTIGLMRNDLYVFEKKIIELKEDYESEDGYEDLKETLKIPKGTEFGFSFIQSNGTILEANGQEGATDIFVREIPIQYVDQEANTLLGTLNIKIW